MSGTGAPGLLQRAEPAVATTRTAPRGRRSDGLARTSWALMANTVTTSALGMVFWVGAGRTYTERQVGEDAALISAMMLLSVVSQLNLAMGISRLLPQVAHRRGGR